MPGLGAGLSRLGLRMAAWIRVSPGGKSLHLDTGQLVVEGRHNIDATLPSGRVSLGDDVPAIRLERSGQVPGSGVAAGPATALHHYWRLNSTSPIAGIADTASGWALRAQGLWFVHEPPDRLAAPIHELSNRTVQHFPHRTSKWTIKVPGKHKRWAEMGLPRVQAEPGHGLHSGRASS
jgi:hypothetical protein